MVKMQFTFLSFLNYTDISEQHKDVIVLQSVFNYFNTYCYLAVKAKSSNLVLNINNAHFP